MYRSQKQEPVDIYGETISIPNLVSYRNSPVKIEDEEEIKTYQPQFSFTRTEEVKSEETPVVKPGPAPISILQSMSPVTTDSPKVATSSGKHTFKTEGMKVGNMQALLDEAAKHNIYFRITSGLREGATTSNGARSWHALGEAIDVTPIEGQTWDELRQQVRNSPEFVKWMQSKGYGILDETTKDMLARTGGSGAHWHIGKDKSALEGLKQFLV